MSQPEQVKQYINQSASGESRMGPVMQGLPKQASLSSKQPGYSTQQHFN